MIKGINIKNNVTQESLAIDMSGNSVILDSIDWGSPSITISDYRVPYQIGQTHSGKMVGTREISIVGFVVANTMNIEPYNKTWEEYYTIQENEINETKLMLDKVFSIYQEVVIGANGYYITGIPSSPVMYSTQYDENNEIMCKFMVDIVCYNPLFHVENIIVNLSLTIGNFIFPWIIPDTGTIMGEVMKQQNKIIENKGDTTVGCIIKIVANGGELENPKIYNVNTGEYIEFIDTQLVDGDYILISTKIGEENAILHRAETGEDISLIGNLKEGSKFLQIEQGFKFYAYSVADIYKNNIDVTIEYTEQYFNIRGM